jgi:hypothetical protein
LKPWANTGRFDRKPQSPEKSKCAGKIALPFHNQTMTIVFALSFKSHTYKSL